MTTVVGIDASRNRSGGAKAHLRGILSESDPREQGIDQVHVWSYKALLDVLPERPWLIKHNPPALERSLLRQVLWQYSRLPVEARERGCSILLNTDAGSVCRFRPAVVMSRDMLSYEPGEMGRYGVTKAGLRLLLLRWIQNKSLRFADGAIFLTQYASKVIQSTTGKLRRSCVIPHGVGKSFIYAGITRRWPVSRDVAIECLYVSNTAMYKHQWTVVRAISELRMRGLNLRLTLVGGGSGPAQRLLEQELDRSDPDRTFVTCVGSVGQETLPAILANANLFIFASSCENMPNTLVEAMAVGLPIACSRRGPMPEILADGGVYFDPEDANSIGQAIQMLISDSNLRAACASRAKTLAGRYSWSRCGRETWEYLVATMKTYKP